MRLGFAIAAKLDPDVLLLDEIFAVGDEDFQKQCMATIKSFEARGKTIVFVSHSATAIQAICDRACLLDHGQLLYDGTGRRRPHRVSPAHRRVAARGARARRRREPRHRAEHRRPTPIWRGIGWPAGGRWSEEGAWVFDFLRRQGLQPDHYVLDVGCGSLSAASRLLPYMEPSHYWGFEKSIELYIAGAQIELPRAGVRAELGHFIVNDDFDLSEAPHPFDVAIASSLFRRLDAQQHRAVPWRA